MLNQAAQTTMTALLVDSDFLSRAENKLSALSVQNCHANWLHGMIQSAMGDEEGRDASWQVAVRCDARLMPMLYIKAPDSYSLAELAVQIYPQNPVSWFWLAEVRIRAHSEGTLNATFGQYRSGRKEAPEEVIELYRTGLHLNSEDSVRWRELGDMLVWRDPQAGIRAYLQSCYTGDSGYNGCWLAGQTAERLGDFEAAIQYYRLSKWYWALERANQLKREMRLNQLSE